MSDPIGNPKTGLLMTRFILNHWHSFTFLLDKRYQSSDEKRRREIFDDNVSFILAHNESYRAGRKSYHLGVNQFADWVTMLIQVF